MLPIPVRLKADLSSIGLSPVSTESFSGMPNDALFKMDAEKVTMEGNSAIINMKPYSLQMITLK
jgi:hypothetical protein